MTTIKQPTPKWTSIILVAEGEPADISRFLDAVKGQDTILDFGRIIPLPQHVSCLDTPERERELLALWGATSNARAAINSQNERWVDIDLETDGGAPVHVLLKLREMFPSISFECRWWYDYENDDDPFSHNLDDLD